MAIGGLLCALSGCKELENSVIVTAQVGEESYRFWVVDPQELQTLQAIEAGETSFHPHGKILRKPRR